MTIYLLEVIMGNSNSEHSKNLRAATAKKSAQKVIDQGGMRVSLLLEQEHADRFRSLVEQCGGQKNAFVALLNNYSSKDNIDRKE